MLHQAAKEAFNELNVKKLPTIKELQTEYAQLLADKKKAYGEYRQARAAMRELLTVKTMWIGSWRWSRPSRNRKKKTTASGELVAVKRRSQERAATD